MLANFWSKAIQRLLPQDCLLCGEAGLEASLCEACQGMLPRVPDVRCPVCALPGTTATPCGECLRRPPHFDTTQAALMYAFPADRLIQQLKYEHRLATVRVLANFMLEHPPTGGDLLLPVPLSPRRLRERGFNQSAELARMLGKQRGLPVDLTGCRRIADTPPQAGLPWKARRRNIRNAFECSTDFSGRHVILIDDVMTTGATLDEVARTLKLHGASSVTAWVAARTDRLREHP